MRFVNRFCTFSMSRIKLAVLGDQIFVAYSRIGLMYVVNNAKYSAGVRFVKDLRIVLEI